MYCRDEEKYLPRTLLSMVNQSMRFSDIILVNDASKDATERIAVSFGATVINLEEQHPSYLGRPELARICNHAFRYIRDKGLQYEYLMGNGADTILPGDYVEEMVKRMDADPRLVISGGRIQGERQSRSHVRGSGRFIDGPFWRTHIKEFPIRYIWESYPLYKAHSLGYDVYHFPDLVMTSQRKTTLYKSGYGHAMRELGYLKFYALARCILGMIEEPRPGGVAMLKSYLFGKTRVVDPLIEKFLRSYQIRHLASMILDPRTILRRFK